VTYQRRGMLQIVIGSILLLPVSLFYLVRDGALVITPIGIVGCVLLVLGLVKRGRGPLDELSDSPSPPRPDLTNPAE
jgi:hypothetical protein